LFHRKLEEEEVTEATFCERLDDLLQQSDFVMLAVRLTPQTQGLMGKQELQLMMLSAVLVNISRGTAPVYLKAAQLENKSPSSALSISHPLSTLVSFHGPKNPLNWWQENEGKFMFYLESPDFCLCITLTSS
jgi:hypothetical protein